MRWFLRRPGSFKFCVLPPQMLIAWLDLRLMKLFAQRPCGMLPVGISKQCLFTSKPRGDRDASSVLRQMRVAQCGPALCRVGLSSLSANLLKGQGYQDLVEGRPLPSSNGGEGGRPMLNM